LRLRMNYVTGLFRFVENRFNRALDLSALAHSHLPGAAADRRVCIPHVILDQATVPSQGHRWQREDTFLEAEMLCG